MHVFVDWLDNGRSPAPELAATVCRLVIRVGDKDVTKFLDQEDGSLQDGVFMPAYGLAEGLARRWWWLVAGRSGSLNLRRFREGYAVPDVTFRVDGRNVHIEAKPFAYDNPPVTFVAQARESIPSKSLLLEASHFIQHVLRRLDDMGVHGTSVEQRWKDIQASLLDEEEQQFCEAAGALGIDPYVVDDETAEAILEAGRFYTGESLKEFLAGKNADTLRTDLRWLKEVERQPRQLSLPTLVDLKPSFKLRLPDMDDAPAHLIGMAAGIVARSFLGAEAQEGFGDFRRLVMAFGGGRPPRSLPRSSSLRANVLVENGTPSIVLADAPSSAAASISFARAIGDYLLFGEEGRSPVTDTPTFRQETTRAFAAETLLPARIASSLAWTGLSAGSIARENGVTEELVRFQLEQADRLPELDDLGLAEDGPEPDGFRPA